MRFEDVSDEVLSVMPGESTKTIVDPLIEREVRWEQDVYCPAFTIHEDRIAGLYRAYGEDEQWRLGYAWSEDGLTFQRSDKPVLYGRPEHAFLASICVDPTVSVSFGDPRIVAGEDGRYYALFNVFQHTVAQQQQLFVASSADAREWVIHDRAFAKTAPTDWEVVPEKKPWRFPHPAIVTRLVQGRFVAARIRGRYWMYLNCLSTIGRPCLCVATSENLKDWEVLRDRRGDLVHPMAPRPHRFDSFYIDTTAAILREDGILLLYNGINDDPTRLGDPGLMQYAHYPAQALFERENPPKLLRRSEHPYRIHVTRLECRPCVFWHAPLYESWCLVPWKDHLLLYWNHGFGRRAVGLWRSPLPARPHALDVGTWT